MATSAPDPFWEGLKPADIGDDWKSKNIFQNYLNRFDKKITPGSLSANNTLGVIGFWTYFMYEGRLHCVAMIDKASWWYLCYPVNSNAHGDRMAPFIIVKTWVIEKWRITPEEANRIMQAEWVKRFGEDTWIDSRFTRIFIDPSFQTKNLKNFWPIDWWREEKLAFPRDDAPGKDVVEYYASLVDAIAKEMKRIRSKWIDLDLNWTPPTPTDNNDMRVWEKLIYDFKNNEVPKE